MILISMVNFILETDWLTTKEFCDKYNVPLPKFTGEVNSSVNELLAIDAIKHRYFVEYAKMLNRKITINDFVSDKPFFYRI